MLRLIARIKQWIMLSDKVAPVEVTHRYGANTQWVKRSPITQHDLEAPLVNANVFIATRAISDAVMSLPVHIVSAEIVGGVEREVDDNDHPANLILQQPNPEHTWSEWIQHGIKSYLNDGNALYTIERMTGPNERIELWPRDPRNVDISANRKSYRFGQYSSNQRTYPRSNILHVRDMDPNNPFWGRGRIQSVREEIAMDYYVNRFNSGFFRNGALFGLMFTPDHDLTEDQHQEILDAMGDEASDLERAFGIFINRYAGKIEKPDMKHSEIAFLELLKHNREKIFGVYGLPPFRGGVMEYANYANALAQDKDFWLNVIRPILKTFEDSINKQVLWPIYGNDVRIKFDIDSVPALQGDYNEQVERYIKLKQAGIVNDAWVREQLGIPEDAKPEKQPVPVGLQPGAQDEDEEDDEEKKEETPTNEEEQQSTTGIYRVFKQQRDRAVESLRTLTAHGLCMAVLADPDRHAERLYPHVLTARSLRNTMVPLMRAAVMERGARFNQRHGIARPFKVSDEAMQSITRQLEFRIESLIKQRQASLAALLHDADRYNWNLYTLEKRIKSLFNQHTAHAVANTLWQEFLPRVMTAIRESCANSMVDRLL